MPTALVLLARRDLEPVERLVPVQRKLFGLLRETVLVLPLALLAARDPGRWGRVRVPRCHRHRGVLPARGPAGLSCAQDSVPRLWRFLQVHPERFPETSSCRILLRGSCPARPRRQAPGVRRAGTGESRFGLAPHLPLEEALMVLRRPVGAVVEDGAHAAAVVVWAAPTAPRGRRAGLSARRALVGRHGVSGLARGAQGEGLADGAAAVPVGLRRGCIGRTTRDEGAAAAQALALPEGTVCEGRGHRSRCGGPSAARCPRRTRSDPAVHHLEEFQVEPRLCGVLPPGRPAVDDPPLPGVHPLSDAAQLGPLSGGCALRHACCILGGGEPGRARERHAPRPGRRARRPALGGG
mmetsp:Transcript_90842/g.271169  ORF Transcript_90842/g.271169 Transcript_90842/m.271169 type:complete len:352 (+) Transcript_90842:506-1561(+)